MTFQKSFVLGLVLTALIASIYLLDAVNQPTTTSENPISGAYQALNAFGAQRAYPYKTFPDKAHFAAWEKTKTAQVEEKNNPLVEPWESIGPHNMGGRTLAIAINPQNDQTIYIGSASGGLWRTHTAADGENAWHYVETGFPVLGVSSIAIEPTDSMTMYIGTGEVYNYEAAGTGAAFRSTRGSYGMGILKTTDGGQTWTKSLDWTYAQNHGIWAIKIDPTNSAIVWSATTEGTYKSTDAGATWTKVHDVVMGTDLLIHPTNPDTVLACYGNLGSSDKGIYRTSNGGVNWQKITSPEFPFSFQGKIQMNYAPSNPDIVYASIGNGFSGADGATWLMRSDDFGATWGLRNTADYSQWQGWFAHDVVVSPTNPDVITMIGIAIWQSDDGGNNVELKTSSGGNFGEPTLDCSELDNFVHSDAHDVVYHPTNPDIIYVAHDGGFSKSLDGGDTFQTCSGGYQTVQFYNGNASSSANPDLFIGGLQDNGTIVYDGDKQWTAVFGGDGSWSAIDPENDAIQYVSYQFLNVFRIEGNDATNIKPPIGNELTSFIAPYRIAPSQPNILYAASTRVYRTDDYGDSWQVMNSGNTLDGNPVLSMEVAAENPNVVYAATAPYISASGVFVTKNGAIWTDVSLGLPNRYPMDLTVDPNNEATAYVTYSGFGTGHVFKTEDYGTTWIDISADLPDVPTNAVVVDPYNSQHVYVGNDLGVYVSMDGGATWETFQDGLPTATMVFDLGISPSNRKLRVGTHGNGAYERDLIALEDVATADVLPTIGQLVLAPNPTSDILRLDFTVIEASSLAISLIDNEGRVLWTKPKQSFVKGKHQYELDVSSFAAGQYWVRISNGQSSRVEPVLVLK